MRPTQPRKLSKTFGVLLIATLVLLSGVAGAGVVSAQDDPPGEPANFYGQIEDENGTAAPAGTEVFAIIDGNVEDSIVIDEPGQYGGPDTFDDKLAVNTGAGDEVVFRINSSNGTEALESPYALKSKF